LKGFPSAGYRRVVENSLTSEQIYTVEMYINWTGRQIGVSKQTSTAMYNSLDLLTEPNSALRFM